ncbi:MAG: hypothetical protein HY537_13495 [Deltaproteobacteria bacterium]|nr:hypothetical protein [Deltaproteobacteria bacterium]
MKIQIERFPHAQYDKSTKRGFLCYYYPYDAVKEKTLDASLWRDESYSPEILNFKEGRDADIDYFVRPFLQILYQSLKIEKISSAILIPLPSAIPHNSPKFSTIARDKTKRDARNRDNRNSIFCSLLSARDSQFQTLDILIRVKPKKEKEEWTAQQHAQSMEVRYFSDTSVSLNSALVLVDDVCTKGHTSDGAKLILSEHFPGVSILSLSLGQSQSPSDFKSLRQRND